MKNTKHSPSSVDLKKFGLIFGITTVILFGLLLPLLFEKIFPIWPWVIFLISGSLALLYPMSLNLLYNLWMLFGSMMAWVNTRLILGLIFYLLFFPFGWIKKIFGKDSLSKKFDTKLSSYRKVNNDHEKNNLENPF